MKCFERSISIHVLFALQRYCRSHFNETDMCFDFFLHLHSLEMILSIPRYILDCIFSCKNYPLPTVRALGAIQPPPPPALSNWHNNLFFHSLMRYSLHAHDSDHGTKLHHVKNLFNRESKFIGLCILSKQYSCDNSYQIFLFSMSGAPNAQTYYEDHNSAQVPYSSVV